MRPIEEIKTDIERCKLCDPPKCTMREGTTSGCQTCKAIPCTADNKLLFEYLKAVKHDIPNDRFEEICEAERDGRCVVLPCKVGDRVWTYGYKDTKIKIIKCIVNYVDIEELEFDICLIDGEDEIYDINYDKHDGFCFGNHIFKSYEEAEQAVKECENK